MLFKNPISYQNDFILKFFSAKLPIANLINEANIRILQSFFMYMAFWLCFDFLKKIIAFIRVTLVTKIVQVSGVQIYHTSSVYCIVCSAPKVRFSSVTIHPPFTLCCLPQPPLPLVMIILFFYELFFFFLLLSPCTFFMQPPKLPSSLTAVSLFFVSVSLFLFCSLDSTYKLNHMVFIFLWL